VEPDDVEENEADPEKEVNILPIRVMAERGFTSLVGKITKLKVGSNYWTWAKDMEICLLRNKCWDVVTSAMPTEETRTEESKTKDNWARGEIHLCCKADVQDNIIDSEHAHDAWTILQKEYYKRGELKVRRLKKEFFSVVVTETTCGKYMKRVRKIVSELKECGEKIKEEDIAYTILLGLGKKYTPLVVTLTNMTTPENPLSLARVSKQILTEEQRLNQFTSPQQKPDKNVNPLDQNVNNLLAHKSDTVFKGDLQQTAFVARTNPGYRQNPYPQREILRERGDIHMKDLQAQDLGHHKPCLLQYNKLSI